MRRLVLCFLILGMAASSCLAQFAIDGEHAEEILACLKKGLNAKTLRRISGGMGGGLINTGQGFIINNTQWVQIKCNYKDKVARPMFEGEMAGLNILRELNLPNVSIAKAYKIIDLPYMIGGACLVIDYLFTDDLMSPDRQRDVGTALAHLHLHNARMKTEQPEKYVSQFGFNVTTYCGRIPQDNEWKDDWVDFIMNNRLKYQIDLLREKMGTEEACGLWDFKLKPNIPRLFANMSIEPALLHGDFWGGNAGQKTDESEAQIYDPALFYGHHEYDLAITSMFTGFHAEFYEAYHRLIPRSPGFEDRQRVYQLFHYLNHWNQYGRAYMYLATNLMRDICLSLRLRGVNYRKIEDDYPDYDRIRGNAEKPIYKRTKNPNKMALFNTTRNRGRMANQTKTTRVYLSTRSKTTWISTTKVYLDSDEETDPPYNGTTLSLKQIYQIFYAQEGYDWMRRKRK